MKKLRSLYMSSNENPLVGMSSDFKKGIPELCLKVNDTIIVSHNYDYYRKIDADSKNLNDSYSISIDKSGNAGIAEIPNYYINLNWYEENIDPRIINDAWHKYNDELHLHEIAKYLIYRDSQMIKDNISFLDNATFHLKLDCVLPSWDVCITLPMYAKLCENIPGFEEKLENSGDLAGQIRGNLRKFDDELINKRNKRKIDLSELDEIVRTVHNLNDEFELAYHIKKQGFDIEFGNSNKNEPDYIINGKKAELKSSFPDTELDLNFPKPDTKPNQYVVRLYVTRPNDDKFMREILESAKNVEKGLKNAKICFNNLTRPSSSIRFYKDAASEKFDYYRYCTNFYKVLHDSINNSEQIVVPYVKPVCSKPRIISFPIAYKDYSKLLYDIEPKLSGA